MNMDLLSPAALGRTGGAFHSPQSQRSNQQTTLNFHSPRSKHESSSSRSAGTKKRQYLTTTTVTQILEQQKPQQPQGAESPRGSLHDKEEQIIPHPSLEDGEDFSRGATMIEQNIVELLKEEKSKEKLGLSESSISRQSDSPNATAGVFNRTGKKNNRLMAMFGKREVAVDYEDAEDDKSDLGTTTRKLNQQKTRVNSEEDENMSSAVLSSKMEEQRRSSMLSSKLSMRYSNRNKWSISKQVKKFWRFVAALLCLVSSLDYSRAAAFSTRFSPDEASNFTMRTRVYLTFFSLDLITGFFISFSKPSRNRNVSQLAVAIEILISEFSLDIIPLIPLDLFFESQVGKENAPLFLFIKLVRLIKAFNILTWTKLIQLLFKHITPLSQPSLEAKISRTFNAASLVFISAYALSCCWYALAQVGKSCLEPEEPNFIQDFDLDDKNLEDSEVAIMYFSMTTISTVGFGDYHPVTTFERLCLCIGLIFALSIVGSFISILGDLYLQSWRDSAGPMNDKVESFVLEVKKMNKGKFHEESRVSLLRFFQEKQVFVSEEYKAAVEKRLPKDAIFAFYKDFIYSDFQRTFGHLWKPQSKVVIKDILAYTGDLGDFNDISYSEDGIQFILAIFKIIEPINFDQGELLQTFDETIQEIYFMQSAVEINYNLKELVSNIKRDTSSQPLAPENWRNKTDTLKKYASQANVQCLKPLACGLYEILFQQRSQFKYSVKTASKGYFIRKKNWSRRVRPLIIKSKEMREFETKVILDYLEKVYFPVKEQQERTLDQLIREENRLSIKAGQPNLFLQGGASPQIGQAFSPAAGSSGQNSGALRQNSSFKPGVTTAGAISGVTFGNHTPVIAQRRKSSNLRKGESIKVQSITHLLQLVQFQLLTSRGFDARTKVPVLARLESLKSQQRPFKEGLSKADLLFRLVTKILSIAETSVQDLAAEQKKSMLLVKELDLEKQICELEKKRADQKEQELEQLRSEMQSALKQQKTLIQEERTKRQATMKILSNMLQSKDRRQSNESKWADQLSGSPENVYSIKSKKTPPPQRALSPKSKGPTNLDLLTIPDTSVRSSQQLQGYQDYTPHEGVKNDKELSKIIYEMRRKSTFSVQENQKYLPRVRNKKKNSQRSAHVFGQNMFRILEEENQQEESPKGMEPDSPGPEGSCFGGSAQKKQEDQYALRMGVTHISGQFLGVAAPPSSDCSESSKSQTSDCVSVVSKKKRRQTAEFPSFRNELANNSEGDLQSQSKPKMPKIEEKKQVISRISEIEEEKDSKKSEISFSQQPDDEYGRRNSLYYKEFSGGHTAEVQRRPSLPQIIKQKPIGVPLKSQGTRKFSIGGESHITEELSHFERMHTRGHPVYGIYSESKSVYEDGHSIMEDIQIPEEEHECTEQEDLDEEVSPSMWGKKKSTFHKFRQQHSDTFSDEESAIVEEIRTPTVQEFEESDMSRKVSSTSGNFF